MQTKSSVNRQLIEDFTNTLSWVDRLFACLTTEGLYSRPISLRNPCVFYLGHLPAFAYNQIFVSALGRTLLNEEFEQLFRQGIDPPDLSAAPVNKFVWPPLAEIRQFKDEVEKQLFWLLDNEEISARAHSDLSNAVFMTLEHYQMHLETFAYMMHQLPYSAKRPMSEQHHKPAAPEARKRTMPISSGLATLGAQDDVDFAWCNEFEAVTVQVPAFNMDKYPVTNADFLEFVESGGYEKAHYWHPDAWEWLRATGKRYPQFWIPRGKEWQFRGYSRIEPLQEKAPVWVSLSEAEAYASWKDARLPTEAEFHRAAYGTDGKERRYPWGDELNGCVRGNFGLRYLSPTPVGTFREGASYFGVEELVGNGWEWTSTQFQPLPGFQPYPSYPGYSMDFFDGRHFVMKGASPFTSERLLRRSFRNWFQAHYPFVYAKFRCVYPS